MSPLSEDIYCSEQIKVPPALPDILKTYTKAAIRTQPHDLLRWSAAYFGALACGEQPAAKHRLEASDHQLFQAALTRQHLATLHRQLSGGETMPAREICGVWQELCQPKSRFDELMVAGGFSPQQVVWLHFLSLAVGTLCHDLKSTMRMTCEIIGVDDPEVGPAAVPFSTFENIYRFLCRVDGTVPESRVQFVLDFVSEQACATGNMVVPRYFEMTDCPSMNFP